MEDGVAQTIRFLAGFCDEIIDLNKATLEGVLKSSGHKRWPAWKAARNFWERKSLSLSAAQLALFEDWEFLLCDTSGLTAEVAASRLDRCFNRAETFWAEQTEALKKLGQKSLKAALSSRHMKQFDMSAFSSILLQRYEDVFTLEQREAMSFLQDSVCVLTPEQRQVAQQRFLDAWERLIGFFAMFAQEIISLEKPSLGEVVRSKRKETSLQWLHAHNFFQRHVDKLSVEQKDFLDDWQLVLCNIATDTAVLLPGIRRSFERACAYLEDKKDDLISLRQTTVVGALSNKTLSKEPLCVFTSCFLKRYAELLPVDLKLQLDAWEQQICGEAVAESEAKRDQRTVDNFDFLFSFWESLPMRSWVFRSLHCRL